MQCVYSLTFSICLLLGVFIRATCEIRIQTTNELINLAGYEEQRHQVTTEDGFVIQFFRLLPNSYAERNEGRPIVVLQHGMFCSSSDWVFAGPERGLGFVLVNLGYDVWLTNYRVNIYGNNSANPSASWDFSFHELAQYDLPAQIDYILRLTNSKKLYYIGHSMGTTAFYVLMSIKPEYNSKVGGMISLSPVAFIKHVRGITIKVIKFFSSFITVMLNLFKVRKVFTEPVSLMKVNLYEFPIIGRIYYFLLGTVFGSNARQFDEELVSGLLRVIPVGTTWKIFQHYFQLMDSGAFRPYDYGLMKNILLYGRSTPPDYNLENVKVPIVLIVGENDYLTAHEDVDKLEKSLVNSKVVKEYVEDPEFTHLDFLWAKDIGELLHVKIIRALTKFVVT